MILAIDQGTSATKALLLDDEAAVRHIAEVPVGVLSDTAGTVEVDPELLWASVIEACTAVLDEAGRPTLGAIGLANQGETVLAWERSTGRPVGPAVVWQDRRAHEVCAPLAPFGEELAELTGLTLDAYFVAPKVAWLRRRVGPQPMITTTDTWLLHRLCGAFVTDVATAGRSLLTDLGTGAWSDRACTIFGIDPAGLPAVTGNAEVVGETTAFGGRVPISGLCVDQQAALFAQRCRAAGQAKCTYGTGAFLLACTGTSPVRSRSGLVGCPAWDVGGGLVWCLDGQVFTAGAAVNWLVDIGVLSHAADLDRLGGSVDDTGGVTFVPAMAGLAAPFWRTDATASFTGISLATTRAHLARAAVEGIAAQVALLAAAAATDLGSALTSLRVDGGLTRSTTLLQVQADLLQCPVEVYPSAHATALGVAAMAALGIGASEPPDHARATVFEPSISADEAAARLAQWTATATHLLPDRAGRR